jgi:hypothetical protein
MPTPQEPDRTDTEYWLAKCQEIADERKVPLKQVLLELLGYKCDHTRQQLISKMIKENADRPSWSKP